MTRLLELFGRPRLVAKRINRKQETNLGRFVLDATTAEALGYEGIGVMVTHCEEPATVVRCLRNLDTAEVAPRWIVMTDSKVNAGYVRDHWEDPDTPDSLRETDWLKLGEKGAWTSSSVIHGTVESVSKWVRALTDPPLIAGMFLFDPHARVHLAREIRNGEHRFAHDRPQIVVDMRASLTVQGWSPPLFILTTKGPRGVESESIARAYCLEAMQYLDGRTLRISP